MPKSSPKAGPKPESPPDRKVNVEVNGSLPGEEPAGKVALYARGREYAERIARRIGGGEDPRHALKFEAIQLGRDVKEVRKAVQFARAVDQIVGNTSPKSRALLLDDAGRLPTETIMKISRTHRDRQRFALAQIAAGRPPLAKPKDGSDPPFDTLDYHEVSSRLARAAGLLKKVAVGLAETPHSLWPPKAQVLAIRDHVVEVRDACKKLRKLLKDTGVRGRRAATEGEMAERNRRLDRDQARPQFEPALSLPPVASARGLIVKNQRDLHRLLVDVPLTPPALAKVLDGVRRIDDAAAVLFIGVKYVGRKKMKEVPPVDLDGYKIPPARRPKSARRVEVRDAPGDPETGRKGIYYDSAGSNRTIAKSALFLGVPLS